MKFVISKQANKVPGYLKSSHPDNRHTEKLQLQAPRQCGHAHPQVRQQPPPPAGTTMGPPKATPLSQIQRSPSTWSCLFCNVCSLSIMLVPHLPQVELQYLKYGSTSVLYNKVKDSFGTLSLTCLMTPIFSSPFWICCRFACPKTVFHL